LAKIKLQGHASGTGVLTITSPNTNADRTITLPDEDVTLGGGVSGIVSSADATAITINSSEQVGIGTGSPSETLHAYKASSADAGLVNVIKVQTSNNNSTGDGSAIAFHGIYNSTEWGFGKIGGANSGSNWGGALEFHTNAGNNSSPSIAYTKQLTITQDGRGLSQFTAKVWCNFNGTGTVAIFDSHNVSSITDTGTGAYDVNFANNMANDDYPILTNGNRASSQYISTHYGWNTTSKALIATYAMNTSTNTDTDTVSMAVFGD